MVVQKKAQAKSHNATQKSSLEYYFASFNLTYYDKILSGRKTVKCCTVSHLGLGYEVWEVSKGQFQASFGELVALGKTPFEAIEKCAKEVGAMGITGARVVKS